MSKQFWNSVIEDVKSGKPLIVVDDENRENEGDFFVAASVATRENIRMMLTDGMGLICTPISSQIAEKLNLEPMVKNNTTSHGTAFTISVDHVSNKTGISLTDRLNTIKAIANASSKKEDFLRPGHIFPLIADDGGLNSRNGHTEAAIELTKLANLPPVGVICEILNKDGEAANRNELDELAERHSLKIISVANLLNYINSRLDYDVISLPTKYGEFDLYNFQIEKQDLVVIKTKGELRDNPIVRLHSECKTGDIFGSYKCDCGEQLDYSLKTIYENGNGILIYLNQEGRGIGFRNKIKAYKFQEDGFDTYEANNLLGFEDDLRSYDITKCIFQFFNIKECKLITNNPLKIKSLEKMGIKISKVINTEMFINTHNSNYLTTKIKKTNHVFFKEGEQNV